MAAMRQAPRGIGEHGQRRGGDRGGQQHHAGHERPLAGQARRRRAGWRGRCRRRAPAAAPRPPGRPARRRPPACAAVRRDRTRAAGTITSQAASILAERQHGHPGRGEQDGGQALGRDALAQHHEAEQHCDQRVDEIAEPSLECMAVGHRPGVEAPVRSDAERRTEQTPRTCGGCATPEAAPGRGHAPARCRSPARRSRRSGSTGSRGSAPSR